VLSASGGVKQFEIDLRPVPHRRFAPAHFALAA
jgi:hypothetical protein